MLRKSIQLFGDAGVVGEILRNVFKLIRVDHDKDEHGVDNHGQPEPIHHFSPDPVRQLIGYKRRSDK